MKYETDKALQIILERGEERRIRKHRARTVRLGSASALLGVLLMAVLAGMGGSLPKQGETPFGAFLLSQELGGYILIAVVMFAVGAGLTLYLLRWVSRW